MVHWFQADTSWQKIMVKKKPCLLQGGQEIDQNSATEEMEMDQR